jgi:hypothetical protein
MFYAQRQRLAQKQIPKTAGIAVTAGDDSIIAVVCVSETHNS